MKKILILVSILCLGVLSACQTGSAANPAGNPSGNPTGASQVPPPGNSETVFGSDLDLMQNQPPQSGDTVAIIHTSMGDIYVRFFPEETPLAYENFVTHARNGYYDGLIFHRVMEDFMIQGGCAEGTGMAGESIWGEGFGPEWSRNLRHFRGALAMAQSAMPNSIGSQFYIVHGSISGRELPAEWVEDFEWAKENQDFDLGQDLEGNDLTLGDLHPIVQMEGYLRYGGTPHLDMSLSQQGPGHTVFGQVISGMDVVDAIAAVETDSVNDRPLSDVVIERITVFEY